jgi:hypothetical protein
MNPKMFLVTPTHEQGEAPCQTIYWCLPITKEEADGYLCAMATVKRMQSDPPASAVGLVLGLDLRVYSQWLALDYDHDKAETVEDDDEPCLLPGEPADYGLVPADCGFDLQTANVTEDDARFHAMYKDSDNQIESFDVPQAKFEQAARGEPDKADKED